MRSLILAAALVLTPLAASAAPAKPAAASAAEIARARAEGDAIIAAAGVADLFTNVTDGAAIELRHNASGLVCGFDPGPGNEIVVSPVGPRGDSVSCTSHPLDFEQTVFAIRDGLNRDMHMASAVAAIQIVYADVKPYRGRGMTMSREGEAEADRPVTQAFQARDGGRDVFILASVAQRNGWVIKVHITAPLDKAFEAQLFAGLAMRAALMKIDEAKP